MPDPDISVRVGLDHDPDDPALTYTDITDRVHYGAGGQAVTVQIGRQDETAEIRPTEMAWAVRNPDNLFTPRNASSAYYGKWETGRRVQIAETVGGVEYLLGTGYLEIPEMAIVDPRSSQPVTVTAVDRLGQLEAAPAFRGTLAECIRSQAGLVEWVPLDDEYPHMSALTPLVMARIVNGFEVSVVAEPAELIRARSQAGPGGDDQSYAVWAPVSDGTVALARAYLESTTSVPVGGTDVVAISVWVRRTADPDGWDSSSNLVVLSDDVSGSTTALVIADNTTTLRASITSNGSFASVEGSRRLEHDEWRLVTVRLHSSTGAVDLWCGADLVASGTVTGPGAWTAVRLAVGQSLVGSLAHVQVRVGADVMTYAEHLHQYEVGTTGLHRQTVADRVVTVAGYAGIPASEVDVPDTASTPLAVARLAGVSPAAALRSAAASGQDTLVCAPDGRITVVPRSQQYNQSITLAIPWGWIGYRGLRYRPDRPVTDVTVSRPGGGQVRRQDQTLASRYGVTSRSYEIDSAIDADAGNLASWTLRAYAQMRTRSPKVRLNMLARTVAERQALLELRVGDRIEITGMPDGSPEDVADLIVQGILHTIGPGRRRVIEFSTSPLLGSTVGDPPYSPMVGDLVSTDAIIAY